MPKKPKRLENMTEKCPACGLEFASITDVAKHIFQLARWKKAGMGRPGRGIVHLNWVEDNKIPLEYEAIKNHLISLKNYKKI